MKQLLLWLFLSVFVAGNLCAQDERFTSFRADITVDTSGIVTVSETIRVKTRGILFKRGITRGFPNFREDKDGKNIEVDYTITSITKDGKPEKYHTEQLANKEVVYIGKKDVLLSPGTYEYTINYETQGQIGFFAEYDELYWNVNGAAPEVKIDTISATLHLPAGDKDIQYQCYTGAKRSIEQNCTSEVIDENTVFFEYVSDYPDEILTIAVGWDKGLVNEPPPPPPPTYFQKNGSLILGALFSFLLLIYYLFTWRKFGVDPQKPTVIPLFSPPENLSPASVHYIKNGMIKSDMLTSSIVSLAVKGFIKIEEETVPSVLRIVKTKVYTITKLGKANTSALSKEELRLYNKLFSKGEEVKLDGTYQSHIRSAVNQFSTVVTSQWDKMLWKGFNAKFWIFPILTIILYVVFFIILFSFYQSMNSVATFVVFILGNVFLFLIYQWLIRKPSEKKVKLRAEIEGFERYLRTAEEPQMQQFNPPKLTPETFEKLLPYAIALGVGKIWGKQFEQAMQLANMDKSYNPTWYNHGFNDVSGISQSLSRGMGSAMHTSSASPSSGGSWSSGSSGGGFSGGGGGGGSVGGW